MVDQPYSSTSTGSQVFMMNMPINVATRSKDYQTPTTRKESESAASFSIPSTSGRSIDVRPPSRGVL